MVKSIYRHMIYGNKDDLGKNADAAFIYNCHVAYILGLDMDGDVFYEKDGSMILFYMGFALKVKGDKV